MKNLKSLFFKLLFLLPIVLWTGCNEEEKQQKALESFQEKKAAQLKESVKIADIMNVSLSAEARDSVSQWPEFLTFQNEIADIQNSSIQEIVNSSNNLKETSAGLISTIPPIFREIPIKARINVLYTKASVLVQETSKTNFDNALITEEAKELMIAFQNLKTQLNEVFLKTLEEFEEEIEKRIQTQDSIQQLELKKDSIS
ncbi:hypothetical protein RBU60_01215 [Mesonia sp. MT50]|uniref:Lipoprotein n=1 Tax=Mesonia profundi TaxID=3070998 RepID=A0ABU0ZZW0_9FLAO|nr:hypothetical protein [Mesonia profundi]MDQ7916179.1 hypothetical protein [Mesonia profundi]